MAKDTTAVLTGPGTLYWDLIDGGEASFPADPTTTPAAGWEDIGYTDEGVAIEADRTFEDIMVEEEWDPLDIVKTLQTFRVVTTLAQNSLDNIQLVLGGTITTGSPVGFDTWTAPGTTDFDYYELLFRTKAPGTDKARDWQFPRAVATGAVSIPHRKAPNKQVLAVEFRIILPSTGDIVTIIDEQ